MARVLYAIFLSSFKYLGSVLIISNSASSLLYFTGVYGLSNLYKALAKYELSTDVYSSFLDDNSFSLLVIAFFKVINNLVGSAGFFS